MVNLSAPKNDLLLKYLRNRPTIERANDYAPQHSRIFKEVRIHSQSDHNLLIYLTIKMVLVTSPSKPFQYTVKGSPRRHIILQEYHDEIEALYKEVENSSQSEFSPPAVWDSDSTLAFVRAVVESTLRRSISDDADIFRNGGDRSVSTQVCPLNWFIDHAQPASDMDSQHDSSCDTRIR